jgi:2-polyprenyl-6-methoxyphenol hydroxylase-like FAD-dependent oxidoreductase
VAPDSPSPPPVETVLGDDPSWHARPVEDAHVVGELLSVETNPENALSNYAARRLPRVRWVQAHSRAIADSFDLDATVRNEALRTRGEAMFKERYAPLTADP